jgi:hypothetical protein
MISKCLKSCFEQVEHALQPGGYNSEHEEYLQTVSATIRGILDQKFNLLDSSLKSRFDGICRIVEIGVRAAETQVEGKAAIWERKKHQVLKAAIVRGGAFQNVDLNDCLAGPILYVLADRWRSEFNVHIPHELEELLVCSVEQALDICFNDSMVPFHALLKQHVLAKLNKTSIFLKGTLLNKQRNLNRLITPKVNKLFQHFVLFANLLALQHFS